MPDHDIDRGVPVDASLTTVCSANHEAFARILRLYARPGQVIVDPTFGHGVFWQGVDRSHFDVRATDVAADGVDFRQLPYGPASADLMVLDPPYRYTPARNVPQDEAPGHGQVDGLYNLRAAGLTNTQAVLDLYVAGMVEAKRVLRPGGFLVLKCQDTVQDGKNVWVHSLLMARAAGLGFACRDLLVVTTASPTKTRWKFQRHCRKAHSYFLVLREGGHFPFGMPAVERRSAARRKVARPQGEL